MAEPVQPGRSFTRGRIKIDLYPLRGDVPLGRAHTWGRPPDGAAAVPAAAPG
ncbi:hypothetical protein [Streptomyces sp. NPDC001500]